MLVFFLDRSFFGNLNFFGGPSNTCAKASSKLQQIEQENSDAMFIILSDVWLDQVKVSLLLIHLIGYAGVWLLVVQFVCGYMHWILVNITPTDSMEFIETCLCCFWYHLVLHKDGDLNCTYFFWSYIILYVEEKLCDCKSLYSFWKVSFKLFYIVNNLH